MYLEELTDVDALETRHFESKARLNRENPEGWLKTVSGFANATGGTLYLGVEDKSNKLIGYTRREADNERNWLNNIIQEHIYPRPNMDICFLRYENNGKELFVIKVVIPESQVKPIMMKLNGISSIYMRREGFTNSATYEEIREMCMNTATVQYDMTLSPVVYSRKDFSSLLSYYSEHNDGKELSDKALSSIGFFDKDQKLRNGALLFSDGYKYGKTDVRCSLFDGTGKGGEAISINRFSGGITESIVYMTNFVNMYMTHTLVKTDNSHIRKDAFPRRAVFEGIINAVAHRDYYLSGTQIQIDMFRDRLEIVSPGSIYENGFRGKTYNLSSLISKRRNALIADILVKCRVMEAAGTGFEKIEEEYSGTDDNHKPYLVSMSDHTTLVLPNLTFREGVCDNGDDKLEFAPPANGSAYDGKILAFCYRKARKLTEISTHISLSPSSYLQKKNTREPGGPRLSDHHKARECHSIPDGEEHGQTCVKNTFGPKLPYYFPVFYKPFRYKDGSYFSLSSVP